MLFSSEIHNDKLPVIVQLQEMEAGNVSRPRSGPAYTQLACDGSGEIVAVTDTVVDVDELLRNRQFASDGTSEVSGRFSWLRYT